MLKLRRWGQSRGIDFQQHQSLSALLVTWSFHDDWYCQLETKAQVLDKMYFPVDIW